MGSATPQNSSPTPMPALNSIAIHEAVLNSGLSSGAPSFSFPYLPKASHSESTTKALTLTMKNQSIERKAKPVRAAVYSPSDSGSAMPQAAMPAQNGSET